MSVRSTAALWAALSHLASAADYAVETEPVVVTARRFEEPRSVAPADVEVISARDIAASPAKTVPELLAHRAGITLHDFFGNNASTTSIDLRGFGISGTQNTLVLVDGRRAVDVDLSGIQWSSVPLAAIDRIEIVRGGGSVLYGEGATSGLINIITKSPSAATPALRASAEAGAYGFREYGLEAAYSSGQFGIRTLASNLQSNGYRRNNENRQSNGFADLAWTAGSTRVSLKLAADSQGIRLPGARAVEPSAGIDELATDPRGTSTPRDWAQRSGTRAAFDWNRQTGFGEIVLGAAWRDKTQRSYFDFGGFPDFRDIALDVWSLTPRVKVNVPLGGRANTLVAGFDWYRWNYALRRSNTPENVARPVNAVDAREDTLGAYVLDTFDVTQTLSLTAGARRERLRLNATDRFDTTAPGAAFGSGAPAGSQRLHAYGYELALRYRAAPLATLTARTSRSYRFANIDEIYETSAAFRNEFQFLRPQTARSHELGMTLTRGRWITRAAAFVIDVRDEIHLDPYTAGVGNRNLPPSRRSGFEIETTARVHERVTLSAAYSYIDAKFRAGVLPGSAFTFQNIDISGRRVPLVPRHKANLAASLEIGERTHASAVLSYVGAQLMDNDEANTLGVSIPAYTLLDLKLVHVAGPWTFAARLNNVLDTKYYTYAVRSQFTADRYNAYPLARFNGSISVGYAFR